MTITVSLIIPVYNSETTLDASLASAVNQSLRTIEIIIINDGSIDNSKTIIQKYAKKYSNIHVITQKNMGLSVARNAGIKIAKGDYISFLDSDDTLEENALQTMYFEAQKNNLDIVTCNHNYQYEDGKLVQNSPYIPSEKNDIFKAILSSSITTMACGRLYKTKLFFENNIYFPDGRIYEDIATIYKLFYFSNKTGAINLGLYNYILRTNSLSSILTSKHVDHMFINILETKQFLVDMGIYESRKFDFFGRYLRQMNGLFRFITKFNTNNEDIRRYLLTQISNHKIMEHIDYELYSQYNNFLLNSFLKNINYPPFDYQLQNNTHLLRVLKNKYNNKNCALIGNPKLLTQQQQNNLPNYFCFGSNTSALDHSTLELQDAHIVTNKTSIAYEHLSPVKLVFILGSLAYYVEPSEKYIFLNDTKQTSDAYLFSDDIENCIYYGRSSLWITFQIIAYMGFSNVFLLGMEHVFSDTTQKELAEREWKLIHQICRQKEITIFNASVGGNLELFPRKDLK